MIDIYKIAVNLSAMSIVPTAITNFNRTERELQEFALFCVLVAGKNSDFAAKKLDAILAQFPKDALPFDGFCAAKDISIVLTNAKTGQYTRLTNAVYDLIGLHDEVGLQNATLADLLSVRGIGPKTARFFILHSRNSAKCAVLDTHVLKFLRDNGYPTAPKQTPQNRKQYEAWEKKFLNICEFNYPGTPIAEVDLKIWTEYSGRA